MENKDIRNNPAELDDGMLEQVSGGDLVILPGIGSTNRKQSAMELSDDALESVAGGQELTIMVSPFYSFE